MSNNSRIKAFANEVFQDNGNENDLFFAECRACVCVCVGVDVQSTVYDADSSTFLLALRVFAIHS